jgi:hypothetical protein
MNIHNILEIQRYDHFETLDTENIITLLDEQMEEPAQTANDYFLPLIRRHKNDNEKLSELATRVANNICNLHDIEIDGEMKEDITFVYCLYKILVLNLYSGFTHYILSIVNKDGFKKSLIKSYKPTDKYIPREDNIVINNIEKIISDITINLCDGILSYLKGILQKDDVYFVRYLIDVLEDNDLIIDGDDNILSSIYKIIDEGGMLASVHTYVLMKYVKENVDINGGEIGNIVVVDEEVQME